MDKPPPMAMCDVVAAIGRAKVRLDVADGCQVTAAVKRFVLDIAKADRESPRSFASPSRDENDQEISRTQKMLIITLDIRHPPFV